MWRPVQYLMFAHVLPVTAPVDADLLTIALAVLAGGLGMLLVVTMLADRRALLAEAAVPFGRWMAMIVAGLSVGAASIHFAVIGAHFEEYPPFGIAFLVLAWFQVGWAVAYLLAPERVTAIAAILINSGAVAVWAASRTVGLPIGPDGGHVEPVGPLDIAAVLMEITLVVLLAWDLGAIGRRLRPALPRAGAVLVLGSSALVVVLLTTTAFVVAGGDPHGGVGHEPAPIGVAVPPSPSPEPGATADVSASPAGSGGLAMAPSPIASPAGSEAPSASYPALSSDPQPLSTIPTPTVSPPTPLPSASRSPQPTPARATATPRPVTPRPTQRPTATPRPVTSGEIRFGTSLDQDGDIATPTSQFAEGQTAVWIADFTEAPNASTLRMFIIQVLTDGREFEHWREDIAVDPSARRFVGSADLSIYLHGGDGRHVMRYMRGDTLLAEGAFDLVR